ncbi:glycosyltransferase, partial [Escherichia coli]
SYDVIYKFKKLAQKADIIHYHFPFPFMDMIHFLTDIDKPTVVTYHSDIIKQKNLLKVYTPLMNRFLKSVSAIVATSPNYFNTSKTLQKFASKVKVIPIGIDANAYAFDDASRVEYWKQKLPAKFLLFVGALRYYKGLDIL